MTNQTESERLAYNYMLNRARETNDNDVNKYLKEFDPYANDFPSLDYLVKGRTATLNKYKIGHLHQGVTSFKILRLHFVFKGYTVSEKTNWLLGADFSMTYLFPAVLNDDLFTSSLKFEIPFYITQGNHDYMVSQVLAKKYLDILEAPKKAFTNSAHSPNMEKPEKYIKIFRKIASENPSKDQRIHSN